jgi:ribosomal protein S18 acetylase RimI-like enzyme
MAEVERILTGALVAIDVVDPASRDTLYCVHEYFAELAGRFETGFDPARSIPAEIEDLRPPGGLLLLATLRADPVGCGALKLRAGEPAELKRMWVAETARGYGIGRRLLEELERHATVHGARAIRLETNASLTEAIGLYRSAGYREVDAFNAEPYAHHWFEKRLDPAR